MNVTFTPERSTRASRTDRIHKTFEQGGLTMTRGWGEVSVEGFYVVGGLVPSVVLDVATVKKSADDIDLADAVGSAFLGIDRPQHSADGRDNGDEQPPVYTLVPWEEVLRLADRLDRFVRADVPGRDRETFIGTWFDRETGKLHLDEVELVVDREEAIRKGRERGELAIFDGTTFEDIRL